MSDAAEKGGLSLNLAPVGVLERYGGKRGKQALTLIALGQMLAPVVKFAYQKVRKREDFTITVPGVDDIYPDIHGWVLERMPEEDRKALIATTGWDRKADDSERMHVQLRYDGSRAQRVTIDGYDIVVAVQQEKVPDRVNLTDNWRQYLEKITFTAPTAAGRDAVVGMIQGLIAERQKQEKAPALFMPTRWGGEWSRRGDLPARDLESVILKEDQVVRLVLDLSNFLEAEEDYNRLSLPWHRGYLFHGAPGTGKTSVARALANHFGLPTYYLPLGDLDKDADVMRFIGSIQPRSVLLLEDIDVFHAATDRTDEGKKVSVAAMLNALDGIWTPHGLITIMTTNNREALDPALIRAGRIDVAEEFTVLDKDQAERTATFFGLPGFDIQDFIGRSPSELFERLKHERSSDGSSQGVGALCPSGS